jgi:epoxide hydrolase-like predicted phosphatase
MKFRAVYFDMGGVIRRTEYEAPREHLAERLGIEYENLVRLVFNSETSRKASLGSLTAAEHWAAVVRKLNRPASETNAIRDEFFAGDVTDSALLDFIRSLRPRFKTGLLSNAWGDLREWMISQKYEDAFDSMTISAEVGVMKPDAGIYHQALKQSGVKAEQAVFVDDFIENVEGARSVGMSAIHFRDPDSTLKELKSLLNI